MGSFVAVPPVRHRIDDGEASLSESMARRGITVRHRVLAITRVEPDRSARFPDCDGGAVEFRFIRYLEDEPWSVGTVALPASLAPLDWDGSTSVFAAMSARHELSIRRSERAFRAGPATPDDAAWLGIAVGSALLELELRGHNADQHGRVIATVAHRIRGDRAEYVVGLPQ
ncbi:GntR family transcriptional regulator [Tsukamurella soli]|uniref:GntR family transcriptional regulator n=1 Tax=Tsukamurella soli TaxID=644556 RepID=UPI0031EF556C